MYRRINYVKRVSEAPVRSLNDLCVTDQTCSRAPSCGNNGFPRTGIALLAQAQTMAEYESIVRQLSVNKPQFNVKEGVNHDEIFQSIKPRWCQMPCELEAFAEVIAKYDCAKVSEKERELQAKEFEAVMSEPSNAD